MGAKMITEQDIKNMEIYTIQGEGPAKINTLEIVEKILEENVPGDFAECGVGGGGQIGCMAYALRKHGQSRTIHLYDSFKGACMPDSRECEDYKKILGVNDDITNPKPSLKPEAAELWQVKDNMSKWKCNEFPLVYHVGYFQNTLKNEILPDLAFLRLDCNLHVSTHFAFKYLYPKLAHGGYFCSDDWGNPFCQEAVHDLLSEWDEPYPEPIPVRGQTTTVWWRKK